MKRYVQIDHLLMGTSLLEVAPDKKVTFRLWEFETYSPDDYNIFFAFDCLCEFTEMVSSRTMKAYQVQKEKMLDVKTSVIEYKGALTAEFINLEKEKSVLLEDPEWKARNTALFEHYHFDGPFPEKKEMPNESKLHELRMKISEVCRSISKELNVVIKTMDHRKYETTGVLLIEPILYDDSDISALTEIAKKVIKNFKFKKNTETIEPYWVLEVQCR